MQFENTAKKTSFRAGGTRAGKKRKGVSQKKNGKNHHHNEYMCPGKSHANVNTKRKMMKDRHQLTFTRNSQKHIARYQQMPVHKEFAPVTSNGRYLHGYQHHHYQMVDNNINQCHQHESYSMPPPLVQSSSFSSYSSSSMNYGDNCHPEQNYGQDLPQMESVASSTDLTDYYQAMVETNILYANDTIQTKYNFESDRNDNHIMITDNNNSLNKEKVLTNKRKIISLSDTLSTHTSNMCSDGSSFFAISPCSFLMGKNKGFQTC